MNKTFYAIKMVTKLFLMLFYEAISESYWVQKKIANVCKNKYWINYWSLMAGISAFSKEAFVKLADHIN